MQHMTWNATRTGRALLTGVLVGTTLRQGLGLLASARQRAVLAASPGSRNETGHAAGSTPIGDPPLHGPSNGSPAEASGPPSSVIGNRIALDLDAAPPTLVELGLENAKTLAFSLQQRRGHARLNDLHGHISGRPGSRWVAETLTLPSSGPVT
jgi:hypothetical protein